MNTRNPRVQARQNTKSKAALCNWIKNKICKFSNTLGRVLKCIVFTTCACCFARFAVDFYMLYSEFPTQIRIRITSPDQWKVPAVTICNRNPIKRSEFCVKKPDLCAQPPYLNFFCERHPDYCEGDVSDLVIPKSGYFALFVNNTKEEAERFLLRSSHDEWTRVETSLNKKQMVTFIRDPKTVKFIKCQSWNFHAFTADIPETKKIESTEQNFRLLYTFKLYLLKNEAFYPWMSAQVYFSVHSPHSSVDPEFEFKPLTRGYEYDVGVRLAEEHLLPYPYETDCTDYHDLWRRNNKTGPRSQEMCRQLCRLSYYEQCYGCKGGMYMYNTNESLCLSDQNHNCGKNQSQFNEIRKRCEKSCKADCLKLKYSYTIEERMFEFKQRHIFIANTQEVNIVVQMIEPEVTVTSHVPTYEFVDLFRHIGGLIGCWLGISVWTLFLIGEDICRRLLQITENCKKESKQSAKISIFTKRRFRQITI